MEMPAAIPVQKHCSLSSSLGTHTLEVIGRLATGQVMGNAPYLASPQPQTSPVAAKNRECLAPAATATTMGEGRVSNDTFAGFMT
mmetsp:Transcript_37247/g.71647  ORF Transcript_37247/g.71647 Transcript_37247/m.71647 type:complete len:85 (+) Transcript_37247:648-902(+)